MVGETRRTVRHKEPVFRNADEMILRVLETGPASINTLIAHGERNYFGFVDVQHAAKILREKGAVDVTGGMYHLYGRAPKAPAPKEEPVVEMPPTPPQAPVAAPEKPVDTKARVKIGDALDAIRNGTPVAPKTVPASVTAPAATAMEERVLRIVNMHPDGICLLALREETHDIRVRIVVDRLYSQGRVAMHRHHGRMTVYPAGTAIPEGRPRAAKAKKAEPAVEPEPVVVPDPVIVTEPVVEPVVVPAPVPETLPTWEWPAHMRAGADRWVAILRVVEECPGTTAMVVARTIHAPYGAIYHCVPDLDNIGLISSTYDETGGRHLHITPMGMAAVRTPIPPTKAEARRMKSQAPEKPVVIEHCRQCPKYLQLNGDKQHGLCQSTRRVMKAMDVACNAVHEVLL